MLNYDQRVAYLRAAIRNLESADALQQQALGTNGALAQCNTESIQSLIKSLMADIECLDPEDDDLVPQRAMPVPPPGLTFFDDLRSNPLEVNIPFEVLARRVMMGTSGFRGTHVPEKDDNK